MNPLINKNILLGVTGSIAAYKAADLASKLTQNGAKVKLKGKGFPVYKKEGQFGDLLITYTVKTPINLSEKEKELFKQLASLKK